MQAALLTDDLNGPSLGDAVVGAYLDPADIWAQVLSLRPFAAPDLFVCCEVAFARIAIVKFMLKRTQDAACRRRAFAGLDAMVAREFQSEGGADEAAFGDCLPEAAQEAVELYYRSASVPALVAAALLERIEAVSADAEACERMLRHFAHALDLTLPRLLEGAEP